MKLLGEIMIDFSGYCRGEPLCSPFTYRADTQVCPYSSSLKTGRSFLRNFLILAFVFICSSPVQAGGGDDKQPLRREDFAFGMELSVSGKSAIYALPLPAQVYQGCTRADLGDLRVFNSRNAVPHLLRSQVRKEKKRPAQALPFFPLLGQNEVNGGLPPDLHISTDSQGTIIDIRQSGSKGRTQSVSSYVVDTAGLKQRADWLELAWSGQDEQFSTSVRIDSSDDLNSWRTVIHSAALAELDFGGHKLLRKRIMAPRGIHRKTYLRISWPAGKDGVTLTAIKAGYDREEQAHSRTLLPLTGESPSMTDQGTLRYQYNSKGFFPVDQLNVRLPEHNSLAQVSIFSRADEEAAWRLRASLLAYRLTVDGVSLDSGVKKISSTTDRFWRIETEDSGGGDDPAPTLELGWLPGQLVFMARGEQPYTLAYGRAGLGAARYQVDRLLRAVDPLSEKKMVMPAQAGSEKILGGKGVLEPISELPWRRWLLWGALIAGVLVVGGMALKLYREMNGSPPGDS